MGQCYTFIISSASFFPVLSIRAIFLGFALGSIWEDHFLGFFFCYRRKKTCVTKRVQKLNNNVGAAWEPHFKVAMAVTISRVISLSNLLPFIRVLSALLLSSLHWSRSPSGMSCMVLFSSYMFFSSSEILLGLIYLVIIWSYSVIWAYMSFLCP